MINENAAAGGFLRYCGNLQSWKRLFSILPRTFAKATAGTGKPVINPFKGIWL